nr:MbeB family mobilization protein [Nissabacter sp. SGAir0207]
MAYSEHRLKRAFSEHEQFVSVAQSLSAKRISDAIRAHETGMNEAMKSNRLNVLRMTGR